MEKLVLKTSFSLLSHRNFHIADRTLFLDFKNAFKMRKKPHAEALPIPISSFGGVYWTKFECISDKIRRILTNDLCASARSTSSRGAKPKNFLSFLFAAPPHTPAENGLVRKFLVLLPPLHKIIVFAHLYYNLTLSQNTRE
ncbi:MAG: hypothetical protein H6759_05525 [Candidatus Nomurabacteria bacterium]|nr:MAG: hypothetical protein H6759_05525 [Candidatus Nomurabacteria bacterium]